MHTINVNIYISMMRMRAVLLNRNCNMRQTNRTMPFQTHGQHINQWNSLLVESREFLDFILAWIFCTKLWPEKAIKDPYVKRIYERMKKIKPKLNETKRSEAKWNKTINKYMVMACNDCSRRSLTIFVLISSYSKVHTRVGIAKTTQCWRVWCSDT